MMTLLVVCGRCGAEILAQVHGEEPNARAQAAWSYLALKAHERMCDAAPEEAA